MIELTNKKRWVKRVFFILLVIGLIVALSVAAINLTMLAAGHTAIFDEAELSQSGETFDCILVLGAGVKRDGTPSDMLRDRLEVGISLYEMGLSGRMLMSGDHMQTDYNEVGVMKAYAVDAGVPSSDVFLDHAGLSTYDSIYRAAKSYGAEKILIVTQEYHLYRALYIAESMGLEAYGVSASLRPYRSQIVRDVREVMARVKDFVLCIGEPPAQYLGAMVDLTGDGDTTDRNVFLEESWQEQN